MKKNHKIPTTQLIQGPELSEIEEETERLNNKLTDCKANLLKFVDKEKQWQKDISSIIESEKNIIRGNFNSKWAS